MTPAQPVLLVTGAAGRLGSFLRRNPPRGWQLRLTDLAVPPPLPAAGPGDPAAGPHTRWSTLDVTDRAAVTAACEGADAVLHLGGVATNAPATRELLVPVNVGGTRNVLDAAADTGIRKVLLAGSNHAAGFRTRTPGELLPDAVEPWPDSLYGVTKATMELLGRHHADQHGADVVLLRIGSCFERPTAPRMLSTWLSPGDFCRLVEAALHAVGTGYLPVWGVSANTRRWWSTAGGDALGYAPRDDAEAYADALGVPAQGATGPLTDPPETVGGSAPPTGHTAPHVAAGPGR